MTRTLAGYAAPIRRFLLGAAQLLAPRVVRPTWLCVAMLRQMDPLRTPCIETAAWTQRIAEQAQDVIDPRGAADPAGGDAQAIGAYRDGVARGFYAAYEHVAAPPALLPVAGSRWSRAQLLRLRAMGIAHGARVNLKCQEQASST
jgi:hypothetical protein